MTGSELVRRRSEEDHVDWLVLDHPPVNAVNARLLEELGQQLMTLATGGKTRCLVITGDGTYFSAGADLKELAKASPDRAREMLRDGHEVLARIERFPAPVIAAINGLAVGAGLEIALACDLRVGGESTQLGAPEVGHGLMPGLGGTQRLPRLVGLAKAKELIYTGALVRGTEALRIGLLNRAVPAGQEQRAARDLAHRIARGAPIAVAAAKKALDAGSDRSLAEGLAIESELFERDILPSADLAEGVRAFVDRRPARFTGE